MFDARVRVVLAAPLERGAAWLDRPGITPGRLTAAGLALGLASAVAAASQWWVVAFVLWGGSRLVDGLDGPLARRRGATEAGGFADIMADFAAYAAGVVGVLLGVTATQGWSAGTALPFVAVLVAYYLNGAAFLAFSSLAERRGLAQDDPRSLRFLGGLAEGTETVVVHSVWLLLPLVDPDLSVVVAVGWAVVVGLSAAGRVPAALRALRAGATA
ncbi:CDP-alcohol phosphatidyltransferase family protein [Nocardioides sp.]|uniref:CDP-alcohol phosphatidyltransferase family protein n=1 Tax=Nocardioides sp. TaxID=35761 RepID=UPI00351492F0